VARLITVAVVEDEPLPRRRIRRMLEETADVRVVAELTGCADAVRWLGANAGAADALFLDIELGDGTGFDVLDTLRSQAGAGGVRPPQVVFVTAYDRFAVQAFDLPALDYLLKPYEAERVERAVRRVRERLAALARGEGEVPADDVGGRPWATRVAVRARGETRLVAVDAIDWIGSADNYVELHCGADVHLVRRSLASVEARLDPVQFARIHRRAIVRLDRVRSVRSDESGELELVLENTTVLRVGRAFRDRLAGCWEGWAR
jgi:two-component system LytT family response regulator